MLILSVDTSGRAGSIALARAVTGEEPAFRGTRPAAFCILEVVPLAGGAFSARLMPELSQLLMRHALGLGDLEGFAVVSGPGSFTGLRVGLATVKGLSEIVRRPIAAVSMLEAIAAQASREGLTIAALEAGRNEVFAGEYEVRNGESKPIAESLLTRPQFSALLNSNRGAELVTPDSTLVEFAATALRATQIAWPDAGQIARLGIAKIFAGETVAADALDANYIRRSDAEIFGKNS